MTIEEVQEKISQAKAQLEEIRQSRTRTQDALRQLDLNEAGWLGYLEAMTTILNTISEQSSQEE